MNVVTWGFDMTVKSEMLAELGRHRPGHTLAGRFYSDPAFYQLDLENIWRREWLFVGHDCEIPKPGDYFTLQVGDHPVVVVRSRDGAIRAFHNTCRHRGSRICSAEKRLRAAARVPLSQLELRARRTAAVRARHGRGFRRAQHGPEECALRERGRLCLDLPGGRGARFRRVPRAAGALFRPARADRRQGRGREHDRRGGQLEARLGEQPRVLPLLAQSSRALQDLPEAPTISGVNGAIDDPIIAEHWRRCEAAGLPSQFKIPTRASGA